MDFTFGFKGSTLRTGGPVHGRPGSLHYGVASTGVEARVEGLKLEPDA
jgi:hypothetical protein